MARLIGLVLTYVVMGDRYRYWSIYGMNRLQVNGFSAGLAFFAVAWILLRYFGPKTKPECSCAGLAVKHNSAVSADLGGGTVVAEFLNDRYALLFVSSQSSGCIVGPDSLLKAAGLRNE